MSKKMLVLYYSYTNGNTKGIAEQLAQACGAQLERIDTVEPYPADYDTTVAQAKREVNEGFEPAFKALEHDPAEYDVIAVGSPTWWYTCAPVVKAVSKSIDWAGKTVVPFSTSAGWPGTTNEDVLAACIGAEPGPVLHVTFDSGGGSTQKTPQDQVEAWLQEACALLA